MVDFKREEQRAAEENAAFERGYDQAIQEVLYEVQLDRLRKREAELQCENARLRDELAKERTAHTATRSSLNDALDNPIFED
jgi:hypothetical protein